MKRLSTLFCALLLTLALTPAAHADAIVAPVEIAAILALRALPYILVAAVVIVTLFILNKFRKKK